VQLLPDRAGLCAVPRGTKVIAVLAATRHCFLRKPHVLRRGGRNKIRGLRAKAKTVTPDDLNEAYFRLTMAERAINDLRVRVSELSQRLAALSGQKSAFPSAAFRIDAKQTLEFFEGFYPCEQDGNSQPFRWTGKSEFFELRLHLDRNNEWHFRMNIRFPQQLRAPKVLAFADFIPIAIEVDTAAGVISGMVPKQPFSNRVSLTFHCDQHFIPRAVDPGSLDDRKLALSFYDIRFVPVAPVSDGSNVAKMEPRSASA
jgi:hypothetical protein